MAKSGIQRVKAYRTRGGKVVRPYVRRAKAAQARVAAILAAHKAMIAKMRG